MEGHRIGVVESERFASVIQLIIVDDWAEMGFADGDSCRLSTIPIVDDFIAGGHITPRAVPLILKRIVRVDFEGVKVLGIWPDIGYAPSDTGIVADDYTGSRGKGKTSDIEGAGIANWLTV